MNLKSSLIIELHVLLLLLLLFYWIITIVGNNPNYLIIYPWRDKEILTQTATVAGIQNFVDHSLFQVNALIRPREDSYIKSTEVRD